MLARSASTPTKQLAGSMEFSRESLTSERDCRQTPNGQQGETRGLGNSTNQLPLTVIPKTCDLA